MHYDLAQVLLLQRAAGWAHGLRRAGQQQPPVPRPAGRAGAAVVPGAALDMSLANRRCMQQASHHTMSASHLCVAENQGIPCCAIRHVHDA